MRVPGEAPSRSVVLLAHTAPPQANAGAARVRGFARHLPELGWDPVVVASAFAGDGPVADVPTVRVGEPLATFQRVRGAATPAPDTEPEPALTTPGPLKRFVLERVLVPDVHVGWVPPAALAAVREARRRRARAIVSSSPTESAHLAALVASLATGLPWIAEFRDGWTFDSLRALQERRVRWQLERALETIVARRADALVGVTRPIAADLEARFGSATWIPNGFVEDPLPEAAVERAAELLREPAFHLVYTGSFRASRATRSPEVVAAALDRLASEEVRLTVAGRLDAHETAMLERRANAQVVGTVPQPVALALQRQADALLLVTAPGEPSVATGKLFEYLGARRPIVALAKDNEAAALLGELSAGIAVDPSDPAALAEAIAEVRRGRAAAPGNDAAELARFGQRALARQLADLLDGVAD